MDDGRLGGFGVIVEVINYYSIKLQPLAYSDAACVSASFELS